MSLEANTQRYAAPVYSFEALPETTLQVLRLREKYEAWARRLPLEGPARKTDEWPYNGNEGYEKEIKEIFGESVLNECLDLAEKNKGELKMVSFGGGGMHKVFELKHLIAEEMKKRGINSEISVVEYALNRKNAMRGIAEYNERESLERGDIRVHEGFLEFQDLGDAEGADIMLSTKGPFYHNERPVMMELTKRACEKLKVGGSAFLEITDSVRLFQNQTPTEYDPNIHASTRDVDFMREMQAALGDGYVINGSVKESGLNGYLQVQKIK